MQLQFLTQHNQSEALPRSGCLYVIQYVISALILQISIPWETSGNVAKRWLFSQTSIFNL